MYKLHGCPEAGFHYLMSLACNLAIENIKPVLRMIMEKRIQRVSLRSRVYFQPSKKQSSNSWNWVIRDESVPNFQPLVWPGSTDLGGWCDNYIKKVIWKAPFVSKFMWSLKCRCLFTLPYAHVCLLESWFFSTLRSFDIHCFGPLMSHVRIA